MEDTLLDYCVLDKANLERRCLLLCAKRIKEEFDESRVFRLVDRRKRVLTLGILPYILRVALMLVVEVGPWILEEILGIPILFDPFLAPQLLTQHCVEITIKRERKSDDYIEPFHLTG